MTSLNLQTFWLVATVLILLTLATAALQLLRRQNDLGLSSAALDQVSGRVRSWWILCFVLATAFVFGKTATVLLFFGLSFWALREFITLTPTRPADHRALFWVFVLFTPLQYFLVWRDLYGMFSIVIPVFGFLFIPARVALAGDHKRYLERCAKIQAGLMICVYFLSYVPALLYLDSIGQHVPDYKGANDRLLFFFVLVVACGDAFQYLCHQLMGKHLIVPSISQTRSWEGFLGGLALSTLLGTALWWATPWSNPLIPAGMSAIIVTVGVAGGLTMSAIKRDRGVKDYGTLVVGHEGVLDRVDSICFAAPVFYHLTRYMFP